MDREQLLQRKALLERKAELLKMKAQISSDTETAPSTQILPEEPKQEKNVLNIAAGVSPEQLMASPDTLSQAAGAVQKAGQDILTVPAHFANQLAMNYPRYATEKAGFEYPSETDNKLVGGIARTAGVVGAIKNPLVKMLGLGPESKLLKNIVGGGVLGGAYASDLEDKPAQVAIGSAAPIGMKVAGKVASRIIPEGVKDKATEGLAYVARKFPNLFKGFLSEEGQAARAESEALKARDKAVKLYPNQLGNLEQIRSTGEQGAKYISPSKNYEELANQMELAKGVSALERQKIYDASVVKNQGNQYNPILKLIRDIESSPMKDTREGKLLLRNARELQTADVDFINNQSPETLKDPNFYQSQKARYQKLSKEAGVYKQDPSQSAKAKLYKAMSEGYQDKTYEIDDLVKQLNLEEKVLIESTAMAREQAVAEALDLKPSMKGEAISSLSGSPKYTAARFLSKNLMDKVMGSPAERLTKGVSRSTRASERAKMLSEALSKAAPEEVSLEYPADPLSLPEPAQRQIPFDRAGNIKRGKYLPPGQSGGKAIRLGGNPQYSEGEIIAGDYPGYTKTGNLPSVRYEGIKPVRPSQIELPEYTESTLRELAKKYSVPEGVREYGSPIEGPRGSSPLTKESWKNLSPKERMSLRELIKRRERNFPR